VVYRMFFLGRNFGPVYLYPKPPKPKKKPFKP